jgi:hypothetical protein
MPDGGVALLEWAKFFASLLTPIAVVAIGFLLNVRLRTIEQHRWLNQQIIEKRLALFERLAPKLNDLLCLFTYVGHWKELDPPHIIATKRELDKEMHVYEALFPHELHVRYDTSMETCFVMYTGSGEDAKLCTGYAVRKKAAGNAWRADWERAFAYSNGNADHVGGSMAAQREAYRALMASFADALQVSDER